MEPTTEMTNGASGASFWQDYCDNAPEETSGFKGEDLPAGAWVLVRTATTENGNAAAQVKSFDGKNGPFIKFNIGLMTIGGDAKISKELHNRRMVWLDVFPSPGPKELEHEPNKKVAGRFTGFLNTVLASGVAESEKDKKARSKARWSVTAQALRAAADENNLTPEAYHGDVAAFTAAVAAKALAERSVALLVKTDYGKEYNGKKPIVVSAFEDATPENLAARNITEFTEAEF
jgi:hypothetical protein